MSDPHIARVMAHPRQARTFEFAGRELDMRSGEIRLRYRLDELFLEEVIRLPGPVALNEDRRDAMQAALDLLHWVAGVSYWKTACAPVLEFRARAPDPGQAAWLTTLYREGLAEFAWVNGLDPAGWPEFPSAVGAEAPAGMLGLDAHSLVPLGGGKDSIVALSRLQAIGEPLVTAQIGDFERIRAVARVAGTEHRVIRRRLAPELSTLNARGAWNGHVPVTAINAAILVVAAIAWGLDSVVFANERSADEATLEIPGGRVVNHQFAKSLACERILDEWIRTRVGADLKVFSLLRRWRELAIAREFALLKPFHPVFSSCNRNYHLDGPRTDGWCRDCPKCRFVFLGLAVFLPPPDLVAIFGADLLAEDDQARGFRELLAPDGNKPFECVGEIRESRAALAHLACDPAWRDHAVVRALAPGLDGHDVPSLADTLAPGGPHRVPERFARAA